MVFSLEHDIKVTKNHQNLLPTQSVLVAHTVVFALVLNPPVPIVGVAVHLKHSAQMLETFVITLYKFILYVI
jgi:hypothetical protein